MALQNIQLPGYKPRKPSTMEQIALGVDMASKILGTGIKAYEVFGPKGQTETDKNQAESDYYKAHAATINNQNYMNANQNEIDSGQSHQVPGPNGELIDVVPRPLQQWELQGQMHQKVSGDKAKADTDRAFYKAKTDLEQMRGNPGLQLANRNLLLAENALSVIKPWEHNLNNIPKNQVGLFQLEEAKIASGGVPTEGEMNSISDPTLYKDISALRAKIMNTPQGAGQAEFIPNHVRYLNDLRENSLKIIEKSYDRKLNDWKSHLSEDDFNTLKQNMRDYLNEYRNSAMKTESGLNGNAVIAFPSPGGNAIATPPSGKIHVSNPKTGEQFYIDPQHLNDAQKEGFQQIK